MKYLMWLLKAAIFFALFAFALNNQAPVHVHLFFGTYWQAPLVLVLLIALALGVALGVLVMLPAWLQARRTRSAASHSTADTANSSFHGS
jgi:uncharacterized integral membrane protein